MPHSTHEDRRAVIMAAAAASLMIAQQVAGKATRDALFLTHFPVTTLPRVVIASAALSALVVLGWANLLRRRGPHPLMSLAFAASGLVMFAIAFLVRRAPALAVVATYLHVAVLGPVLISGFWSLLTERFDPRAAKRAFGRIGAFGALGGLAGGVLAQGVTARAGAVTMLPVLGILHLGCAGFTLAVRPEPSHPDDGAAEASLHGLRVLARSNYLRTLGGLVLLGAVSAALLDYVFKANAAHALHGEASLMRLFSAYHTGVALLAFAVQLLASRRLLERAGLARTVSALPLVTFAGSLLAVLFPGLASALAARGAEGVVRNSLFRSGYELLFTPIRAAERRASKIFVDVGFERTGDAIGGALVAALLAGAVADPSRALLWISAGLSALTLGIALRIHRGYVATLESSLLAGDITLDPGDAEDMTTRSVTIRTQTLRMARNELLTAVAAASPAAERDPLLARAAHFASGDAERIRIALGAPLSRPLVPAVIPLLERDDLAPEVARALRPLVAGSTGELGDALAANRLSVAARRRIARLLGTTVTPRTLEALFLGLASESFAVRQACGRELARIRGANTTPAFDETRVYAAVLREVEVERGVWQSRRDLERHDDGAAPGAEAYLSRRASASLAHVFTLLSLVLAPRPLDIAFRGLHAGDRMQRGMALEYLESVLPAPIRARLWAFLEADAKAPPSRRPREEILADLLRSHDSIRIAISKLGEDRP